MNQGRADDDVQSVQRSSKMWQNRLFKTTLKGTKRCPECFFFDLFETFLGIMVRPLQSQFNLTIDWSTKSQAMQISKLKPNYLTQ